MHKTLVLSLALLLSGCVYKAELRPGIHVYPSDLQPPAGSVLAWPADATGESFRWVETDATGWLPSEGDFAETGPAGEGLGDAAALDGIVVLLPSDASEELRAAATELVGSYVLAHPRASSSTLFTPLDFTRVDDVPTMSALLQQARLRHRTERPTSLADALLLVQFQPRYVVMPIDADGERFAVMGSFWDDPSALLESEHDADGAVEYVESRLMSDKWDAPSLGLLIPEGATDAGRERCEALALRIEGLRAEQGLLVRAPVADAWEAETTSDMLQAELLARGSIDRYFVGPVEVRFTYRSSDGLARPARP